MVLERKMRFSGTWYPKDPNTLSDGICSALQHTTVQGYDPRLAILPHSGLIYSMRSFAHLIKACVSPIDHVIVCSPSHYLPLEQDRIYQSRFTRYETPFGPLENYHLDLDYPVYENQEAFAAEHAVEMVMPILGYIQKLQKKPIGLSLFLMNHCSNAKVTEDFVYSLEKGERDEKLLYIASSDFSHYGSIYHHTPFTKEKGENLLHHIKQVDTSIISDLINYNHSKSSIYPCNACGYAAMSIISQLAKVKNLHGNIVDYYHSSDISHEYEQIVSYATVFFKEKSHETE